MARGFAADFALAHPGYIAGALVAAGAFIWWRRRQQAALVGTPQDPNGAFYGNNQATYDDAYNGLLGADTNWQITDARGAIRGFWPFNPLTPATKTGILTPFTPFP